MPDCLPMVDGQVKFEIEGLLTAPEIAGDVARLSSHASPDAQAMRSGWFRNARSLP